MKREIEILKVGDEILTKLKEQPNNICTQLNKNEEISFNTGFHRGFVSGYTEAVKNCSIPDVSNRRALYFAFMKEYNALMGEGEHEILKEEVEVLLAKYSC